MIISYYTNEELSKFTRAKDEEVNELLQKVRAINPKIHIHEDEDHIGSFYRKITHKRYSIIIQNILCKTLP